jgi:hypothetical protein
MGASPVSPQTPTEPLHAGGVVGGPGEPSRPSWLKRNWKWFAGGILGFIVGAVAGAGGESGTNTTTKTVASVKTVPKTVTQTQTKTVTKTQTAAQPTSGGSSSASASAKSFSGNGGKNLGPLTVQDGQTLQWTNDGDVFQLIATDSSGLPDILVNSQAHKGDTALTAASYKKVEVNAVGNWTIKITGSS